MKAYLIVLLLGLTLSYNPSGAISYARTYCSRYNGRYKNYAGVGGDCANFVSQCVSEGGGLSLSGCSGRDSCGMLPAVSNLKSCLRSKGFTAYSSKPKNFRGGYPIFLKSGSHAMLATGVNGNTITFCGHTNDRCDSTISASSVDFYF